MYVKCTLNPQKGGIKKTVKGSIRIHLNIPVTYAWHTCLAAWHTCLAFMPGIYAMHVLGKCAWHIYKAFVPGVYAWHICQAHMPGIYARHRCLPLDLDLRSKIQI